MDDEINKIRSRYARLTERRVIPHLKQVYETHTDRMFREMHQVFRRKKGSELDRDTQQALINRIRTNLPKVSDRLTAELHLAQEEAHRESLTNLVRFISKKEGKAFSRSKQETILEERLPKLHQASKSFIEGGTKSAAGKLAQSIQASAQRGFTADHALRAVETVASDQFWRVASIAKTEASLAYNAAQSDGIAALAEEVPDLMMQWIEHVDLETLAPLDDRVGKDSIALHGQVKMPHSRFHMPDSGPKYFRGDSWDFPPNRPHDRAIIVPWKKDWGTKAWIYRNGSKVWINNR